MAPEVIKSKLLPSFENVGIPMAILSARAM